MSNKKPSVFPTQDQISYANETGELISNQLEEENVVQSTSGSDAEAMAAAEMKKRTDDQLRMREENLKKNEEISRQIDNKRENQMSEKQPYNWDKESKELPTEGNNNNNHNYYGGNGNDGGNNNNNTGMNSEQPKSNHNVYIEQLSKPQMNQPFDLIPLPSEGKMYPGVKKNIKVAFLTTADENILTSPNLVESGEFLEILINRKLLEPNLRYRDLLPGDRDAIMIWLRATGYGEMYPVTLYDNKNETFDTEVNLSELKTINLNVNPGTDGLFDFELPLSKNKLKLKLLTVGDVEDLQEIVKENEDNLINEEQTLILENRIVSVNGNKDRIFIKEFAANMRVIDAQKLREFMSKIECGVDMTIEVRSPGGETIKTFLPLTTKFFWPNSEL